MKLHTRVMHESNQNGLFTFFQHYQLEQTKTKYKIDVRKKQKSQQQLLDVPWTVLNVSHKRIS